MFLIVGVYFRCININYASNDFKFYVSDWISYIEFHGILKSFKSNFSNYSPPYLHLLSFKSFFKIQDLYFVKFISFIFEIFCTVYVFKILKLRQSTSVSLLCSAIVFCLPTIILNGAKWGQCDIIYSSFIICSLYYLLQNKYFISSIALGFAFAFKQQALFIAPLYFFYFLYKKLPVSCIVGFIVPYIISLIPSWVAGRPIMDLLTIYINQDATEKSITVNAPSVYCFFNVTETNFDIFKTSGIIFTLLCLIVIIILFRKILIRKNLILFAVLISLLVPFLLPRMHERYFMVSEILSIIYVFYYLKNWLLPFFINIPSYITYHNYFNYDGALNYKILSIYIIIAVSILILELNKRNKKFG